MQHYLNSSIALIKCKTRKIRFEKYELLQDEKGFQAKIRRLSDHDTLFDDVLKKANMYRLETNFLKKYIFLYIIFTLCYISEKYSKPDRLSSREPSAQSQLVSLYCVYMYVRMCT